MFNEVAYSAKYLIINCSIITIIIMITNNKTQKEELFQYSISPGRYVFTPKCGMVVPSQTSRSTTIHATDYMQITNRLEGQY